GPEIGVVEPIDLRVERQRNLDVPIDEFHADRDRGVPHAAVGDRDDDVGQDRAGRLFVIPLWSDLGLGVDRCGRDCGGAQDGLKALHVGSPLSAGYWRLTRTRTSPLPSFRPVIALPITAPNARP